MKIFNWIFSSFFRTLGRFLFYIAVGLLVMLFISGKVHAATSPYLTDVTFPTNLRVYNLTASDSRSSIDFNKNCFSNDSDIYDICYATWDGTFATYGYGLNMQTTTAFTTDFYYGVTYYFGSNINKLYSPEYSGYGIKNSVGSGWNYQTESNIISYSTNGCLDLGAQYNEHVYGYRYLCTYSQVFQAKSNGFYLWSVFNRSTTGSFTEEDFAFIGYSIVLNGAGSTSASEIKDALSDDFSDLENSITSSTNSLNANIDSMKDKQDETNEKLDEQIQQDKEQHQETMNTITSEDMPDLDFDVVGWLPQGSIDSLINLPLTLLNTMNSQVSASCSPYQLPYIGNTTISIPCIGDYLSNLDGWGYLIDTLDIFMGVLLIYKLLMSLYKDVQKILSLKENDDELGGIE